MKKIISAIMICALLCAAVLPVAVSAEGKVLFKDEFDSMDNNDWVWDGDLFECIDGRLEGYASALVHQTNFLESYNGDKMWGTGTSFRVDAYAMDDDSGNGDNRLFLWWCDYFGASDDDEMGSILYCFGYNYSTKQFFFNVSYEGDEAKLMAEDEDGVEILIDEYDYKMDMNKPDKVQMGMKIDKGVVYCYNGDKCLVTYNAERGEKCGTTRRSPILLWNIGCYCAFDNFIVTTADYNLFNEDKQADTTSSDTTASDETTVPEVTEPETTEIVSKVVEVTDENGEKHTEIVTEIVTAAPKQDTQKNNNNGGNSVQTGDMAIIVIAVMVVALGSAVVVKKANVK